MDENGDTHASSCDGEDDDLEIYQDDIEEVIDLNAFPAGNDGSSDESEAMQEDTDNVEEGEEIADMSIKTFSSHTKSVFSIAILPNLEDLENSLIVTGGEDDFAYIWRISQSNEPVCALPGHSDSIICTEFDSTGNFLLTVDASGKCMVWRVNQWVSPQYTIESGEAEWAKWHPCLEKLIVVGLCDGSIQIFSIRGHMKYIPPMHQISKTLTDSFPEHQDSIQIDFSAICEFMASNPVHCVIGNKSGDLIIWDIKQECKHSQITAFADKPISCMYLDKTNYDYCVVGTITGPTLKSFLLHRSTQIAMMEDNRVSPKCYTEDVIISHCNKYIIQALMPQKSDVYFGQLVIWSIANHQLNNVINFDNGINSVKNIENGMAALTSVDGCIHIYDILRGCIRSTLSGHTGAIMQLAISGNLIATASDDKTGKLFILNL